MTSDSEWSVLKLLNTKFPRPADKDMCWDQLCVLAMRIFHKYLEPSLWYIEKYVFLLDNLS